MKLIKGRGILTSKGNNTWDRGSKDFVESLKSSSVFLEVKKEFCSFDSNNWV